MIHTPSVFSLFFNEKTLDYLFDNQAFVGFAPSVYDVFSAPRFFFGKRHF
jgi:hypothetical protein